MWFFSITIIYFIWVSENIMVLFKFSTTKMPLQNNCSFLHSRELFQYLGCWSSGSLSLTDYYTPSEQSCWGVCWFHSVRPSVCMSVCPSVRPASPVRSVAPTVLVGFISYLYILSRNFKRCVAFKVSSKFSKFLKFVTLTLSCFDLGSDVNH